MTNIKPLSIRLEADLLTRINDYCQDNSIQRSSFIRLAVTKFLDQIDEPTRVATLDSEARSAIDKLNERLMAVEQELKSMKALNNAKAKEIIGSMFS